MILKRHNLKLNCSYRKIADIDGMDNNKGARRQIRPKSTEATL